MTSYHILQLMASGLKFCSQSFEKSIKLYEFNGFTIQHTINNCSISIRKSRDIQTLLQLSACLSLDLNYVQWMKLYSTLSDRMKLLLKDVLEFVRKRALQMLIKAYIKLKLDVIVDLLGFNCIQEVTLFIGGLNCLNLTIEDQNVHFRSRLKN